MLFRDQRNSPNVFWVDYDHPTQNYVPVAYLLGQYGIYHFSMGSVWYYRHSTRLPGRFSSATGANLKCQPTPAMQI